MNVPRPNGPATSIVKVMITPIPISQGHKLDCIFDFITSPYTVVNPYPLQNLAYTQSV